MTASNALIIDNSVLDLAKLGRNSYPGHKECTKHGFQRERRESRAYCLASGSCWRGDLVVMEFIVKTGVVLCGSVT